jgi:single-stranded-DNA-specific exonuclease
MLRTWQEPEEVTVPDEYWQSIGGNRLVSQVLYTRGYKEIASAKGFLSPNDYQPAPPSDLPGVEVACKLLQEAIAANKLIGVWGDFDVDGQTSTTVLVSALQMMRGNVVYHIPVRAEESHGINQPALEKFIQGGVELVLTCDTGISSYEAIEHAREIGVPVIITDHHDLPDELPPASAIVNPKFLPSAHPLSYLPGVGVAYKLVEALFIQSAMHNEPEQFLDLVALGLVADIALLKSDNRYLLQLGLDALRHTKRPGLLAMMELAELNQANLTEEHIAYVLAPRMNALGRLDDANSMVELLTTSDMGRARLLALELEGMNAQRKLLTDQVYQAARAQLDADPKLLEYPILVLSHPSWPAGVIGIVASRLVEQYHRPVILISAPAGKEARGSARSIEGINITSAIAANQSLVKSFGGHPMAAGLSMDAENIPGFRRSISRTLQDIGVGVQLEKDLHIDGYLSLPELSLDIVEDLERLAPFGAGNPSLVFAARNLKLTGYAAVGRAAEHLQLSLEDELGHTQRSIWWQGAGYALPEGLFDLAFTVRTSTFRGQRDVQIEWIDYRQVESQSISLIKEKRSIDVIDLRTEIDPLQKLEQLIRQRKVLVWGEAQTKSHITCDDRLSLIPSEALAIWTIPPGPDELQSALRQVNPTTVYLFAIDPRMDEPEAFLKCLAGLIKKRLHDSQGMINLSSLAAATAQRVQTMVTALDWLEDHGIVTLISRDNDAVKLIEGTGKGKPASMASSSRLNTQLAESAAFRRYYQNARKDRLIVFEDNT